MYSGKKKRYFQLAPAFAALALFFGVVLFLSGSVTAQKIKQLPPPPPAPRYKPKPTPTPEPPEYEVIRVSSNLVMVPVSVTDERGQPILGLQATDFRLEENGQTQAITQLGDPEQVPVDIALLIDVSSSVTAKFAFEQKAAADFLKQVMKGGDKAAVFAIDETPRFIQGLSTAESAAQKLLTILPGKGYTAFFDSILAAEAYLDKASSSGRRRLIFSANFAAPQLLKPARLINARSRGKRNRRGRGLPGCASLVTEPTSMKPKPNAASACAAVPFLSRPAASPIGLPNSRPKRVSLPKGSLRKRLSTIPLVVLVPRAREMECRANSCADSAGRRNRIGRKMEV